MAADEKQAISKAAFAKAANVSRARVSQWLASGRISGPALTGSGRHQRIIADIACSQLKGRLDASQRPTNGRNTHLPDDRIALMAATTDEQMRLVLLQERTALAEIRRTQA